MDSIWTSGFPVDVPSRSAHQLPSGSDQIGSRFLLLSPLRPQKLSLTVAEGPNRSKGDVQERIPEGWEHPEDEGQWMSCDSSYDYTVLINPIANAAPGCQ